MRLLNIWEQIEDAAIGEGQGLLIDLVLGLRKRVTKFRCDQIRNLIM